MRVWEEQFAVFWGVQKVGGCHATRCNMTFCTVPYDMGASDGKDGWSYQMTEAHTNLIQVVMPEDFTEVMMVVGGDNK